ncbi:MAG: DUF1669 domain-containing protein [Bacteroidetes bacterium]|nr:DUF1669 domain-containing protein [Bacteroidota bacterium]
MEYHFDEIKSKVLRLIDDAEFIVFCAVAWITDYDVIAALTEKSRQGVKVELLINDDEKFLTKKQSFKSFIDSGGKLFLYPKGDGIMHNKFCVIDLGIIVTGSFNWTYSAATKHEENIVVLKDNSEMAKDFARQFNKLKKKSIIYQNLKASNNDSSNLVDVTSEVWYMHKNDYSKVEIREVTGVTQVDFDFFEATVFVKDESREGWFTIQSAEDMKIPKQVKGYWGGLSIEKDEKNKTSELWNFHCTDERLIEFVIDPKPNVN